MCTRNRGLLDEQYKTSFFFNSKKDFKDIKKAINKLKRLVKDNLKSDYVKGIGYKSKRRFAIRLMN